MVSNSGVGIIESGPSAHGFEDRVVVVIMNGDLVKNKLINNMGTARNNSAIRVEDICPTYLVMWSMKSGG